MAARFGEVGMRRLAVTGGGGTDATAVTAQNSLLHLLNSLQKSYMMFDSILILSQNKLIKDHDTLLPLQHPGAMHACKYPTRIPSLDVSMRYLYTQPGTSLGTPG